MKTKETYLRAYRKGWPENPNQDKTIHFGSEQAGTQ